MKTKKKTPSERPEIQLIGEAYSEYIFLELKQRFDCLYFSMLVLQKAGASRKDAIAVAAPIRRAFKKVLKLISKDLERSIERIRQRKRVVIFNELPDKVCEADIARTMRMVRKEEEVLEELHSIDPALKREVSRFLKLYNSYYLKLLARHIELRIDIPKGKGKLADSPSFKKLLQKLEKKKGRVCIITGHKRAKLYKQALKGKGSRIRVYSFADNARIREMEKDLRKKTSIAWLKKNAAKKGISRKRLGKECSLLAGYFGVGRI